MTADGPAPAAAGPTPPPVDAVVVDVHTRHGRAVAHVHPTERQAGVLVLGHGAGGGVFAPDLVAVAAGARSHGWTVVLVEQPYRAAGKRVGPRPAALDEAWCDVVAALRAPVLPGVADPPLPDGLPLVCGGRSAGARVACRTAPATGAAGVVALAFPTRPPGRPDRPDRLPELEGAGVPVLVVQGSTDPYGVPPEAPGREVVVVPGDHSLKKDVAAVAEAVTRWLVDIAAERRAMH